MYRKDNNKTRSCFSAPCSTFMGGNKKRGEESTFSAGPDLPKQKETVVVLRQPRAFTGTKTALPETRFARSSSQRMCKENGGTQKRLSSLNYRICGIPVSRKVLRNDSESRSLSTGRAMLYCSSKKDKVGSSGIRSSNSKDSLQKQSPGNKRKRNCQAAKDGKENRETNNLSPRNPSKLEELEARTNLNVQYGVEEKARPQESLRNFSSIKQKCQSSIVKKECNEVLRTRPCSERPAMKKYEETTEMSEFDVTGKNEPKQSEKGKPIVPCTKNFKNLSISSLENTFERIKREQLSNLDSTRKVLDRNFNIKLFDKSIGIPHECERLSEICMNLKILNLNKTLETKDKTTIYQDPFIALEGLVNDSESLPQNITYWDYWKLKNLQKNDSLGLSSSEIGEANVWPSADSCYDPLVLLEKTQYPVSLRNSTFQQYSDLILGSVFTSKFCREKCSLSSSFLCNVSNGHKMDEESKNKGFALPSKCQNLCSSQNIFSQHNYESKLPSKANDRLYFRHAALKRWNSSPCLSMTDLEFGEDSSFLALEDDFSDDKLYPKYFENHCFGDDVASLTRLERPLRRTSRRIYAPRPFSCLPTINEKIAC